MTNLDRHLARHVKPCQTMGRIAPPVHANSNVSISLAWTASYTANPNPIAGSDKPHKQSSFRIVRQDLLKSFLRNHRRVAIALFIRSGNERRTSRNMTSWND